jgi:hypothetical protein
MLCNSAGKFHTPKLLNRFQFNFIGGGGASELKTVRRISLWFESFKLNSRAACLMQVPCLVLCRP